MLQGPSPANGDILNRKLSAISHQLEGQKAEEKKGLRHCHWLSYFKLHTSNFSVAPGSAHKTGCHCEFSAPEGAYVRNGGYPLNASAPYMLCFLSTICRYGNGDVKTACCMRR